MGERVGSLSSTGMISSVREWSISDACRAKT